MKEELQQIFRMRDGSLARYLPGLPDYLAVFFQEILLTKEGSEFDQRIREMETTLEDKPKGAWFYD